MPDFAESPVWSAAELKAARDLSESLFKQERSEEGPKAFAAACEEYEPQVRSALAATDNLLELTGEPLRLDPSLWQLLRYFCGPPISEEDLWTLVGGPKFKAVPADYADETAEAISHVIDTYRFPWVSEARSPVETELEAAIRSTTVLLAGRRVGTDRRGTASSRQELAVGDALHAAGFELDAGRSAIMVLDELPRGHYSRERRVASAKCDVPARLRDGRLLAIECKVSNGPKNGWKRVNRETGGKAQQWRGYFGAQVITAIVLSGVYDLSCLQGAQDSQGVLLFWEHDLNPLADLVAAAI